MRFRQRRRLCLEPLEQRCLLTGSPVILSEILANNNTGILDSASTCGLAGNPEHQQHAGGEPERLEARV